MPSLQRRSRRKCNTLSTPRPSDQMPYRIFKDSPSLVPALLCLFNTCWSSSSVPMQWKVGVLHLLGNESAKIDPSAPNNVCPITLTSCVSKLCPSVLEGRWMQLMTLIRITVTSTPLYKKVFAGGVSACTEHRIKLLTIIEETRQKHKSLVVYWLNFANNAFGSVHHNLIHFMLKRYYVHACIVEAVCKCTRVLIVGPVHTKVWSAVLFLIVIGIYKGIPFLSSYEHPGGHHQPVPIPVLFHVQYQSAM